MKFVCFAIIVRVITTTGTLKGAFSTQIVRILLINRYVLLSKSKLTIIANLLLKDTYFAELANHNYY